MIDENTRLSDSALKFTLVSLSALLPFALGGLVASAFYDEKTKDMKLEVELLRAEVKTMTQAREIMGNLAVGCFESHNPEKKP